MLGLGRDIGSGLLGVAVVAQSVELDLKSRAGQMTGLRIADPVVELDAKEDGRSEKRLHRSVER